MPCGYGACAGCVVPLRSDAHPDGFRYGKSCVEGPVFPGRVLLACRGVAARRIIRWYRDEGVEAVAVDRGRRLGRCHPRQNSSVA